MQLHWFDTLDSTQLHARREIDAGRGPLAPCGYVAQQQTGGVGRLGRAWWSPRGGVWMTIVFPVNRFPMAGLSLALGCALCEVCEATAHAAGRVLVTLLKWPNDVMVDDRKLAGVLIEGAGQGTRRFLMVGVGVNANVNVSHLPHEIGTSATSIQMATGAAVDIGALAQACAGALEAALRRFEAAPKEALDAAAKRLWGVGREVPITAGAGGGSKIRGVVCGIGASGELIADVDGVRTPMHSAQIEMQPADAHG